MSRAAHDLTPPSSETALRRQLSHAESAAAPRVVLAAPGERSRSFTERAMLLWPRLDRDRLRRLNDDPNRIAGFVSRRTSQPFDAILAMLTRQMAELGESAQQSVGGADRPEPARTSLRVVRQDEEDASPTRAALA